jgi:hypothetical protein
MLASHALRGVSKAYACNHTGHNIIYHDLLWQVGSPRHTAALAGLSLYRVTSLDIVTALKGGCRYASELLATLALTCMCA